jgi:ubiquinone/menaquinone biosynthesis C-methylase UbiE
MPLKETEIMVEAFTEMAPDYERKVDSELNFFWGWSYQRFLQKLIQSTPIYKNDLILDVATGTGVISHHLASKGLSEKPIHALDITLPMLKKTGERFKNSNIEKQAELVCGSAMEMPYNRESFTLVICGLATHHMDVEKFISESHRILVTNGRLSIIDAGGSLLWKIPWINFLMRCGAYLFFLFTENHARAWAESAAVSNVRAKEDWESILRNTGFKELEIIKLSTKNRFIPSPLLIKAIKI